MNRTGSSPASRTSTERRQLALDRSADEILKNQLQFSGFVREYASEEQDAVVLLGKGREKYFVTADPLDGSSLVDTNLSMGTIIGIHKESVFTRGRDSMVAALYITYGPLITMVYSAGKGAHEFVLNREGEYVLSKECIMLDKKGSIYSPGGLRKDCTENHVRYLEYLEAEGYKLRYSGGFVPDINQVLIKRGGVFTYPALKKSPRGKLRLLFELQPMAFIIEHAGGDRHGRHTGDPCHQGGGPGAAVPDLYRKPIRGGEGDGVSGGQAR